MLSTTWIKKRGTNIRITESKQSAKQNTLFMTIKFMTWNSWLTYSGELFCQTRNLKSALLNIQVEDQYMHLARHFSLTFMSPPSLFFCNQARDAVYIGNKDTENATQTIIPTVKTT